MDLEKLEFRDFRVWKSGSGRSYPLHPITSISHYFLLSVSPYRDVGVPAGILGIIRAQYET